MTRTPWTTGERVSLGLAGGLLISLLILAQVPDFNVWGAVQEFDVTPTGLRTLKDKRAVEYVRVVERGRMGIFYLIGNVPEDMAIGVTYRLSARLGWRGPHFARRFFLYKIEGWDIDG